MSLEMITLGSREVESFCPDSKGIGGSVAVLSYDVSQAISGQVF